MIFKALLFLFTFSFFVSAPSQANPNPMRMLLMDLKATRIDGDLVGLVSNVISSELAEYPDFELLTSSDLRQMVELEAEKQSMGCSDDSSCLAELAGAIGARYVVFGEMGKLGSSVLLALNLFDSSEAKSLGRVTLRAKNVDQLVDQVPGAIQKLLKNTYAERSSPVPPPPKHEEKVVSAVEQASPSPSPGSPAVPASQDAAPGKSVAALAGGVGLMAIGLGTAAYGGWGFSSFESVMNSATSTKTDRETVLTAYVGAPLFITTGVLALAGGGALLFGPAHESENE